MKKFLKVCAIIMALALVFSFFTCDEGDSGGKRKEDIPDVPDNPDDPDDPDDPDVPPPPSGSGTAILDYIKIAGVVVQKADIPELISEDDWDSMVTITGLDEDQTKTVTLAPNITITEKQEIEFVVSEGALVEFARATGTTKPTVLGFGELDENDKFLLANNSFLYVRVESDNGTIINYYRFSTVIAVTDITSLTIGGKTVPITANMSSTSYSTPHGTWDSMNGFAEIIPNKLVDPEIVVTLPAGLTYQYAKVAKGSTVTTEPVFTAPESFSATFADGDFLYIKVAVFCDKHYYRWYKIEIQTSRIAVITAMTFAADTAPTDILLGVPQLSEEAFDAFTEEDDEIGAAHMEILMPSHGFAVAITLQDPNSTVTVKANGADVYSDFTSGARIIFNINAGQYLWVKVTSAGGTFSQYYKIKLNLVKQVMLKYATPTGGVTTEMDDVWDSVDWLYIDRVNTNEGDKGWATMGNQKTHGRAKLLWDDTGIWVYAQVWEKNVSTIDGGSQQSPREHEVSSLEIFIDESRTTTAAVTGAVTGTNDNRGGQYRLSANAGVRSGAPTTAVTAFSASVASASYKKFTSVTSPDPTSTLTSGYEVMFRAPWRFTSNFALADNKLLGLELQINAMGNGSAAGANRVGVLNWNAPSKNCYSDRSQYGFATLDFTDKP